MKKDDLKKLIKPLVKECIHEVLLESGLLTNIVSEVAQGMNQNVIVETEQKQSDALFNENLQMRKQVHKTNEQTRRGTWYEEYPLFFSSRTSSRTRAGTG